ncbi:MAG: DUF2135 domain-containing protein [Elusimicrobiota bacterium]|nr:DUF2135 domain-containing protein [Elusimicrobiota bacterium]
MVADMAPAARASASDAGRAYRIAAPASARSSARTMSRGKPAENKQSATVSLQAWNPDTPYLKILKQSSDSELYKDYLKIKRGYEDQPSFYFDVSDEFVKRKMNDKALIVLSNIAEMKLDNVELLRILGNKLLQLGYNKYAVDIFEQVVKLGGENPQPYRDLALAYQAAGQYQKALDNLYKIMLGSWDNRFGKLKQIIFVEMNDIIARYKVNTSKINKEFIFKMPVDIRITLGWSSDSTDIDLHVTDPYNETAYFGHRLTAGGGHMSNDITQGFGPEEFMIKKALEGSYKIKTNNFSDSRQSVSGPVTLYLDIFTFYGTDKETHQRILVRTENVKEDNIIGSIDFSNSDIEQENKSEKENTDSNIKRKFKSLFGVK